MFGYVYPTDDLRIPVQMITQDAKTLEISLWNCDASGLPISPPDLTLPGANITLALLPGGRLGANIDYTNQTWRGFTSFFVSSGQIVKSSLQIAVNSVTKEQVTVGNDWTMAFVSGRLSSIVASIPYPTFAGFLDLNSGYLVASSDPTLTLIASDRRSITPLSALNNSFGQDVSNYFAATYPGGTAQSQMLKFAAVMDQSNTEKFYINRNING
ncbi:hypothetical protein HDU99_005202, partial [Rhizoclosmatium hyalinum]